MVDLSQSGQGAGHGAGHRQSMGDLSHIRGSMLDLSNTRPWGWPDNNNNNNNNSNKRHSMATQELPPHLRHYMVSGRVSRVTCHVSRDTQSYTLHPSSSRHFTCHHKSTKFVDLFVEAYKQNHTQIFPTTNVSLIAHKSVP